MKALWNRFWFEADGRAQISVFRQGFAWTLFACYLIRSLDMGLFYGSHGIMPLAGLDELAPMEFRYSLFRYFPSDAALQVGNGVFLASLLAYALGIKPRLSVLVAWVLHLSFVHRNLSIAYGVDLIACFFLFYLSFADYRDDRAYRPGDLRAVLGSMAFRLCQIQVCIIYGYSGVKKLKGALWWNGEALWNSLADPQLARWDFTWIAHYPLLIAAGTYLTLAWEIYFPALIWIRPVRKPLLWVGILLHAGIGIGLGLPFFAILMILTYVFFLDREELERMKIRFRSFRSIVPKVPAPASE